MNIIAFAGFEKRVVSHLKDKLGFENPEIEKIYLNNGGLLVKCHDDDIDYIVRIRFSSLD